MIPVLLDGHPLKPLQCYSYILFNTLPYLTSYLHTVTTIRILVLEDEHFQGFYEFLQYHELSILKFLLNLQLYLSFWK